MKQIISLIFICFICFADWDQVDQSRLDNINTNVSNLNGNVANIVNYIDTYFTPNWQIQREQIRINSDWLEALYEGYDPNRVTGETVNNDLRLYKDIYNTVSNFGNYGFQMKDETNDFLNYIHSFSTRNYENSISVSQTANPYMNNGQYFNYSEKMLIKLNNDGIDQTDSWFEVDVYNGQQHSVKGLKGSISQRVEELKEVPENLPNQITNPNVLFVLNLNTIFDLFVRLGLWQANSVQNMIVRIKLIPEQGDYLYDFYTWWNSEQFYPKTFKLCLNALICLYCFYYCYNYVVSTWNA